MSERTAFPEPYPADAGVLAKADWWWAYGPMLLVAGIAICMRVAAHRLRSDLTNNSEGDTNV